MRQVKAEPKARRRARASPRDGVWRKPNPKARGDEQEPDTRCGTSGTSRHVTAKSSIRGMGVLYKSGVYVRNVLYLTLGDPPSALGSRLREKLAEQRGITVDRLAEVSRGQSRRRKRAGREIRKPHLAEGPNGGKGEVASCREVESHPTGSLRCPWETTGMNPRLGQGETTLR